MRIDRKNLVAHGNRTYFFRDVFEDGCVLAFWSDSPWGRVHDQDRGWVVIDPERNSIVDEKQTYYFGSLGGYREWMKKMKKKHGKIIKSFKKNGKYIWRMNE